jgi:acetyl-CoA synthetase
MSNSTEASTAKLADLKRLADTNPDAYFSAMADRLAWFKKWDSLKRTSFKKPVSVKWYEGGKLNVSFNCLDRHLATRGDKIALIWEPDGLEEKARSISYRELAREVGRFANTLKKLGVKRGDRVTIYMPMIPEAAFAMLACSRIGAIHSVVFGGFSPSSISDRMHDGKSTFIITADEGLRGGKKIPLKKNVDEALELLAKQNDPPKVDHVLVVKRTGANVEMKAGRDLYYEDACKDVGADCAPAEMDAEDPLFMLYTSGSTGKPKGVLHTTGGYLTWAAFTHELIFDLKEDDIYWCTADVGWITGHSYMVYGPLANGATSLMFEGVPNFPDSSRFWQVVDKHKVSILYTAPTAIRALMREGDAPVKKTSRKSLRILGSVGEPINPEAWNWYHQIVGDGRCPIVDTWWQTETGGILISPIPFATEMKPGSAMQPLPGIKVELVDEKGNLRSGATEGNLVITDSWPGQMRTVYGDHPRFEETYFSTYPGMYFTGDGCRRDQDGDYWITGRVDDVLNVAGHRLGTAEIESALVAHPKVAEAAIVGFPHDIKGTGIYAYVTLVAGETGSEALKKELITLVRTSLSPIATPDALQWAPGLPKTRSGKIMRRILRKIAEASAAEKTGEKQQDLNLGDTSTLADPSVVTDLVNNRQRLT